MSNIAMQGGATGSGTVSLVAPSTSTNRTLTLPDATGTVALQGGAGVGKVLQVVNATYATQVSNSTNVYADTGLTATITPTSASSKILVLVSQNGSRKINNTSLVLRLVRTATGIIVIGVNEAYTGTTLEIQIGSMSTSYLDSPATTSAITYKTQFYSDANIASVSLQVSNSTSTITLMEIAA